MNNNMILLLMLCMFTFDSHAIVIRHDMNDEDYLAEPKAFPPLATFYIDGAHGTLIAPQWVVTAAHASFCIKPDAYTLINGKVRKIDSLYVHAQYEPGNSHDIALVKLKEPVTDVLPASLYAAEDEQKQSVWFIGIGGTGNGLTGETLDNYHNAGKLRRAQNTVETAKGPLLTFTFDQGTAALPLEGVSGGGDSGGPAFIQTSEGFALMGISSRFTGSGIGRYGITEIYSRISYFNHWIQNIMTGDAAVHQRLATHQLNQLPGGLTQEILPSVCADIGLTENSVNIINPQPADTH